MFQSNMKSIIESCSLSCHRCSPCAGGCHYQALSTTLGWLGDGDWYLKHMVRRWLPSNGIYCSETL